MNIDIVELRTPRGRPALFQVREGTSDLSVLGSVYADVVGSPLVDEYRLADLHIAGRFLDIGAHIGAVGIAVLLDNPGTTAIFVEPIPENLDALRANIALNGLGSRSEIMAGAVGTNEVSYDWKGSETAVTNRFIGNLSGQARAKKVRVRRFTLADLLPATAMKVDCEGGEWALLAEPAVTAMHVVFGEYHGNPGAPGVEAVFGETHKVVFEDIQESTGLFSAVLR